MTVLKETLHLDAAVTEDDEIPDALGYGKHSLFKPNPAAIDVRDLLDDMYDGRHSYEWLYDRRQLPTPAYDLVVHDYEDW